MVLHQILEPREHFLNANTWEFKISTTLEISFLDKKNGEKKTVLNPFFFLQNPFYIFFFDRK